MLEFNRPFRIRMHYEAYEQIDNPVFGVAVLTDRDERVFLTDNIESQYPIQQITGLVT